MYITPYWGGDIKISPRFVKSIEERKRSPTSAQYRIEIEGVANSGETRSKRMPIRKQDAQRALKLLENYRAKLGKTEDRQLRASIERVINIFRSNLFKALIDIQEFYEVSLLDNQPVLPQKTGIIPAIRNWDISSLPNTNVTSESLPISLGPSAEDHSLLNEILGVLQTSVPTQVIHGRENVSKNLEF